jgi:hypothetical protein
MPSIMSFRPSTLVLVVIVAALSLVAFEPTLGPERGHQRELWAPLEAEGVFFGVFAFILVLGSAIGLYRIQSSTIWFVAVLALLFSFAGVALLPPHLAIAWAKYRRDHCARNLAQIAVALANYREDYGCYPPACVNGADGKPMHSWRILILPYLGYKDLYDQYDFKQPWNGPINTALAERERKLDVFSCPDDGKPDDGKNEKETNYVVVTGQNTAWNENIVPKSAAHADKLVLLVEAVNSGIGWMQPGDFDRVNMADKTDKTGNLSTIGVTSGDALWTLVACADGSVWKLPKDFPAAELLKRSTVDTANETDWNRFGARVVNPNDRMWGLLITRAAFPIWLLFVILLLYRARRSGIAKIHAHSKFVYSPTNPLTPSLLS